MPEARYETPGKRIPLLDGYWTDTGQVKDKQMFGGNICSLQLFKKI